jgi:hypothetical protein
MFQWRLETEAIRKQVTKLLWKQMITQEMKHYILSSINWIYFISNKEEKPQQWRKTIIIPNNNFDQAGCIS